LDAYIQLKDTEAVTLNLVEWSIV